VESKGGKREKDGRRKSKRDADTQLGLMSRAVGRGFGTGARISPSEVNAGSSCAKGTAERESQTTTEEEGI